MTIADRLKNSVMLKLATAGFLMLMLLIPAASIQSLVSERSGRRDEAVTEVSGKWGGSQQVAGPILAVPYRQTYRDEKNILRSRTQTAYFLPETLRIQADAKAELRRRGIYEVTLYTTQLRVQGNFLRPDFDRLNADADQILWKDAFLAVGIPDTRGIRDSRVSAKYAGGQIDFQPGPGEVPFFSNGIHARVPNARGTTGSIPFEITFDLQGSSELTFAPLGKQTSVEIQSGWTDPSFFGSFLPATHEINKEGFKAIWKVSFFGRGIPQEWTSQSLDSDNVRGRINQSSFGVRLIIPVDFYQKVERAVKYALLFIGLTFLSFLLFEIFNRLHIHPMQYLLVGSALCVFYLLFLSLSEHIGFTLAYIVAAGAIIALITGYCSKVLGDFKRGLVMAGLLVGLYGYLYFVLHSQDYALLLGSILVMAVLSVVMYLTRNIDWYSVSLGRSASNLNNAGNLNNKGS